MAEILDGKQFLRTYPGQSNTVVNERTRVKTTLNEDRLRSVCTTSVCEGTQRDTERMHDHHFLLTIVHDREWVVNGALSAAISLCIEPVFRSSEFHQERLLQ